MMRAFEKQTPAFRIDVECWLIGLITTDFITPEYFSLGH